MLIYRIASGTQVKGMLPRTMTETSASARPPDLGSTNEVWDNLRKEIDVARVHDLDGLADYEIDCFVLDVSQNSWIRVHAVVLKDGVLKLYIPHTDDLFASISLHYSMVIGHLYKHLLQINSGNIELLLFRQSPEFARLAAIVFTWARMRPAGIFQKLWCPPVNAHSAHSPILLSCELQARSTFDPKRMRWGSFLARLKRDGYMQFYDSGEKKFQFGLKISDILASRIILVHPSVSESNKVLLLFPDMGGPNSYYLRFKYLDDVEDWLATLKAFAKQPVAVPCSHEPRRSVRWYRGLQISVHESQILRNKSDTEVSLRGVYVDVCWNNWVFARTCINPSPEIASWNQTFDVPAPESAVLGSVFPFKVQLKLKQCQFESQDQPGEGDPEIGVVRLNLSSQPAKQAFQVEITNKSLAKLTDTDDALAIELTASVALTEIETLDHSYYQKLRHWVSDFDLQLSTKLAKYGQSSESLKLVKIFSDLYAAQGSQIEWIMRLVAEEADRIDLASDTLFRGSSFMTRAVELLFVQQGEPVLQETVGKFIQALQRGGDTSAEVDPSRIRRGDSLEVNLASLRGHCTRLWALIRAQGVPPTFSRIFQCMRIKLKRKMYSDEFISKILHKTLASFLFLRFYCPALLNPHLFNLTTRMLEPNHRRTVVLVAKVLQGFANGVSFGSKEHWLIPMNNFITENSADLDSWYREICGADANGFEYADTNVNLERLPKIVPIKTYLGQCLTSPNLIDEWATYARLVNFVMGIKDTQLFEKDVEQDDLLNEVFAECKHIAARKDAIIKDLEREDSFEHSRDGSPLDLFFNRDTMLFGLNEDLLDANVMNEKRHVINTDTYAVASERHVEKHRSLDDGRESHRERHKPNSVRRITQLLKLSK